MRITDPLGNPTPTATLTFGTGRIRPGVRCQDCNDEGLIPVWGPGGYLVDEIDCHCTPTVPTDDAPPHSPWGLAA